MDGQCLAVVSGKGGTGKTSFTAGVGCALALQGLRVLCLDCDAGLRNLDIVLGLSDLAFMDFSDVIQGRCSLLDATVEHPRVPGLFLLTAPASLRRNLATEKQMRALLDSVRQSFDFCLLDAPAGLGHGFRLAVFITTSDAASLRDAQHTVMECSQFPRESLHLVVNRVRRKLLRSMHASIDDAIDQAGLPLIGVVPEDDTLPLAMNLGVPLLLTANSGAAAAYRNIAKRIQGQRVPLMRIR